MIGWIQNQCRYGVNSFTPRYRSMPPPTMARPIVIGMREPIRQAQRPASGAVMMMATVAGRKRRPAPTGE